MSETNAIAAAPPLREPRAAIARAAAATGEDFGYLLAQARIESGLDPMAMAATSSAAGLYQFTRQTWLETLDRHGAAHGLGWAGAAIENGRVVNPGLRAQIMALRFDPEASARMAAELAGDNRDALVAALGRTPDHAELYLAHFLGAEGAGRFMAALEADPQQSAPALLPAAAAANRAIFFDRGSPRSLGEVMALVRGKVDGALEGESSLPLREDSWEWRGAAPANLTEAKSPPSLPSPLTGRGLKSMADTLASTFGTSAEAPAAVRAAYGKLRAFGL